MYSGFVQWEVQLEGRVECSAAILGDFSEVESNFNDPYIILFNLYIYSDKALYIRL